MNVYEILFFIIFLWSSFFTVSMSVYNFKVRNIFPAVNAVVLELAAIVLCVFYLFF